jgi:hypothetical protein
MTACASSDLNFIWTTWPRHRQWLRYPPPLRTARVQPSGVNSLIKDRYCCMICCGPQCRLLRCASCYP